jgi:hypothetical protein
MNLLLPMFTLLIAQRQGDSSADAAKAALMTAAVQPGMAGLMVGIAMAANAAKPRVASFPIALPPPPPPTPAKLTADVNTTKIKNDGSQTAIITVVANDSNQKSLQGAQIDFSADSGVISPVSALTDTNGLCTSVLSIGTDKTVRTINVTAACGSLSAAPFQVDVVGGAANSGGPSPGDPSTPPAGPDLSGLKALLKAQFDDLNIQLAQMRDEVDRIKTRVDAQLGQSVLAQVAPPGPQRREVPSFLWKSKEQARSMARQLGLPEPTFIAREDPVRGVVIAQQPKPGSSWSEEDEEVSLELG